MPTATNPKTGERYQLIAGAWVPLGNVEAPTLPAEQGAFGRYVTDPFLRGIGSVATAFGGAEAATGLFTPKTAAAQIAAGERYRQQHKQSAADQAGTEAIGASKTVPEFLGAVIRHFPAAVQMGAESLGTSVPAMVGGGIGAITGPWTSAAGVGFGSAAVEFGLAITEPLQKAGVDLNDQDTVERIIADPEFMALAKNRAVKRGVAVGTFDALAGLMAGKFVRGATGVGSFLGRSAAEFGLQGGAGGAGEAAAEKWTGEPLQVSQIAPEVLFEGPGAIVDTVTGYAARRGEGAAPPVIPPGATVPPPAGTGGPATAPPPGATGPATPPGAGVPPPGPAPGAMPVGTPGAPGATAPPVIPPGAVSPPQPPPPGPAPVPQTNLSQRLLDAERRYQAAAQSYAGSPTPPTAAEIQSDLGVSATEANQIRARLIAENVVHGGRPPPTPPAAPPAPPAPPAPAPPAVVPTAPVTPATPVPPVNEQEAAIRTQADESAAAILGEQQEWELVVDEETGEPVGVVNQKGERKSLAEHLAPIPTPLTTLDPVVPSPAEMAAAPEGALTDEKAGPTEQPGVAPEAEAGIVPPAPTEAFPPLTEPVVAPTAPALPSAPEAPAPTEAAAPEAVPPQPPPAGPIRPPVEPPAPPRTAEEDLQAAREFVRTGTLVLTPSNLARHLGVPNADYAKQILQKLAAKGEILQTKSGNRFRRKALQKSAQTFTQFVAQLGGLHRSLRNEVPDAPRLVPGYGPLFRRNGLSEDDVREAAVEAGYLREDADANEVFRLLDDENRGKKTYRGEDLEQVEQARQDRELERDAERAADARDEVTTQAAADETTLTDQEVEQAVRHMLVDGLDASHAIEMVTMSAANDWLEANPNISEPVTDDDIPFDDFGAAPAPAEPSEGAPAGEQAGAGARPSAGEPAAEAGGGPAEQERPEAGAEGGKEEVAPPPKAKTEKGAEGLDQFVLPGAEASAQQAMDARKGKGKKGKGAQKAPDEGIFAPPPDTRQEDIEEAAKAPAPAPTPPAAKPSDYGKKNVLFTEDAAAKARARLKAKLSGSQLNVGFDPELAFDGLVLAGYHIEAGARKFLDYARAMLGDLGPTAEPYLRYWYDSVRTYPGMNATGMSPSEEIERVLSSGEHLEPDRGDTAPGDGLGKTDVPAPAGRPGEGAGQGGGEAGSQPSAPEGGRGLPDRDAALLGAGGDSELPGDDTGWNPSLAERGEPGGGGGAGEPGLPTDSAAAGVAKELTLGPTRLEEGAAKQKKADKTPVETGHLDNIRATLPLLQPEQQDDVFKAETRYAKPDGHGFMLTNGTGTGKTWSGMGVIKRLHLQGKTNILVVAPSQGILDGWIEVGAAMGVPISKLESTTTPGTGTVATTYANLRENRTLGDRDWDMVVADESQHLMQKQDGAETDALRALRALTLHPDRIRARAEMQLRDLADEVEELGEKYRSNRATVAEERRYHDAFNELKKERDRVEAELREKPRGKALFLSATPFAYVKVVDYGNGYLFEYPKVKPGGYNAPDPREAFLIENFGFRMRTGKLTAPEAGVDSEIMERAFHEKMKREGSLTGRALTVDKDYDRKFILVDDAVGNKIDQALDWLNSWSKPVKVIRQGGDHVTFQFKNPLYEAIMKRFDYLARMRLLEAIKARHAIPIIRQHMELGRKIVVFHDYNEGGGFNPFDLEALKQVFGGGEIEIGEGQKIKLEDLYNEFVAANPYVKDLDFGSFQAPIAELTKAFPDALVYNGTVTNKRRNEAKRLFNTDGSSRDLIIVQSAAGEAGISLHDTSGRHQRVTLNLGMPVRPVTAIQEEGRIYRVGQKTNAIQRYFNSGTNWERWTFAGKIAERSGTAENLAMGDEARTLKESFIDAFRDADEYPPHADEGTGGKEADKARSSTISPFQRAKTYYWAQRQQRGRRDQREGIDYFPTPEPVGMKMGEWADIKINDDVLEPSAGHGAIARFLPQLANRTLVEPAPELASRAALASPGAGVLNERFEDLNIVRKYDAIVMNPPYGVGGKTAIEHLDKAVKHLRNGGRVVALIPEGGRATTRFDEWLEQVENVWLVADMKMPPVLFERAGTTVSSHIVILEKQNDKEQARQIQTSHRDFSDATTINDLFDRIEEQTVKPRLEPKTKDLKVTEQPTASGGPGVNNVTAGGIEFRLEGQDIAVLKGPKLGSRFRDVASVAEKHNGYYTSGSFFFRDNAGRTAFLSELENPPAAPAPGALPAVTFINGDTIHGKTGEKVFVATLVTRLDTPDYQKIAAVAKKHDGHYSNYNLRGAIPGFQFQTEAARAAFLAETSQEPGAQVLGSTATSTRLRMGIDRLVAGAESMSSWRNWYDRHKEVLARLFDDDAGLFQQLLSATSQAQGVKGNVTMALRAFGELKRGEPFTGYLPGVISNLERVRATEALRGPKISAFGEANVGVENAVAVDRHIGMLMFGNNKPTPRQITKARATVNTIAKRLGWQPRQVQAALWAFNQVRTGVDPSQVQSYDTILEARADEIAALRSAFADVGGAGAGVPGRSDLGPGAEERAAGATAGLATGEATSPAGVIAQLVGRNQGNVSPDAIDRIQDTVAREIARIAGPDAEAQVYETLAAQMSEGGEIPMLGGMVGNRLGATIAVALYGGEGEQRSLDQIIGTARHEALHFLYGAGAIPEQHWQALQDKAGQWRQLFGVDDDPAYQGLPEGARNEEGIAKAYGAWSDGRLKLGPSENAAMRFLQRLYRGISNAVKRALGIDVLPTPQEVFQAITRGDFANARSETAANQAEAARTMLASTGLGPGTLTTPVNLRQQMAQLHALNNGLLQRALQPMMRGKSEHVFDRFRRIFQDRFLRVARVEEAMEASLGRPLTEAERMYLAEEGYYSKVHDHKLRLEKDFYEPIVKAMHDYGIKREEVDEYEMAMHAEERNAKIASINPLFPATGPDASKYGSGMTDKEAQDIKAAIPAAKQAGFDQIHQLIRGMLEQRLDWMVQSGLISADQAAAYRNTYQEYVPLRGVEQDPLDEDEDALKFPSGPGFMGTRAKEKRAFGRTSRAPDVLATAMAMADNAYVRGEKNLVAQTLLNSVRAAPDPKVWSANPVQRQPYLSKDRRTGIETVKYRYMPHYSPKDTVSVRVGGREFRIQLVDPLLLRAFSNLGGQELGPVLSQLSRITGLLSKLNTMYSPEFLLANTQMDISTALINLGLENQPHLRIAALKLWKSAWAGTFHYIRTGKTDTPMSAYAAEFRRAGGATAFNPLSDVATMQLTVDRALKQLNSARGWRKAGPTLLNLLEDANTAVDNAIRLAVYVALRQIKDANGNHVYTQAQAASVAKNLTINFNRKGELGPAMNALFMFANAGFQGTATIASALIRSAKVRRFVYGTIALGAVSEIIAGAMPPPEDDDKGDGRNMYDQIKEWEKAQYMIIPYGTNPGEYVKFRMPYGYAFFHNLGRLMAAYLRGAQEDTGMPVTLGGTAAKILHSFATNMIPPVSGIPSIAEPFIDLLSNSDWLDRPIMPTRYPNDDSPESQRYFPSVNLASKKLAELLNSATGGNEFRSGHIDISPEAFSHIVSTYAGGAGRILTQTGNQLSQAAWEAMGGNVEDPHLTWKQLPFIKKAIGSANPYQQRDVTYQRMGEIETLANEAGSEDKEFARKVQRESRRLLALTDESRKLRRTLGKMRKERLAIKTNAKLATAEKRRRIDRLEEREGDLMTRFNQAYMRALTARSAPAAAPP